jgi:hypothetical protein
MPPATKQPGFHVRVAYLPLPPERRTAYRQAFDLVAELLMEFLEQERELELSVQQPALAG